MTKGEDSGFGATPLRDSRTGATMEFASLIPKHRTLNPDPLLKTPPPVEIDSSSRMAILKAMQASATTTTTTTPGYRPG